MRYRVTIWCEECEHSGDLETYAEAITEGGGLQLVSSTPQIPHEYETGELVFDTDLEWGVVMARISMRDADGFCYIRNWETDVRP